MKILDWAIKTDIGVSREENQDAAAVFSNSFATFAILCDGMGGHKGGRYASTATIATFEKNFSSLRNVNDADNWFSSTLEKSIKLMRSIPIKEKNNALFDMGTTVVAALIFGDHVRVYNVGDSRCFYYNGVFYQVTVDQNLKNYLIREEGIPKESADNIYGGNALTSSLGPRKKTDLEIFEFSLDQYSKNLILTSDGVHDYISKPNFENLISSKEMGIGEKCDKAIANAIKNNSTDNLTIVILDIGEN